MNEEFTVFKVNSVKNRKEDIDIIEYIIKIYGIVQGVGFRPSVYKKAKDYKIYGWVKNVGGSVVINCKGERSNIKDFVLSILNNPPPIAKIEKFQCAFIKNPILSGEDLIEGNFIIKESINEKNNLKFLSSDVAICQKCLEDIKEKGTNRYRYAFTNCTDCGPRYSIIKNLPYDRKYTTMESFNMCDNCKKEYDNPLSRRFHAEPNCCEKCGPKLFLTDKGGKEIKCNNPIEETSKLLLEGKILAIKGIGGFHLVCNGRDEETIKILRSRKNRKDKPLALMAKDIHIIKDICNVSNKEEEILTSNKRPIVILKKKSQTLLPEIIAPRQKKLGVMLPYTALHHLLFNEKLDLLIMTSGNISGGPMEYKNKDALSNLSNIADYFLIHNRDIYIPVDDSVVKVIDGVERVIRRGRGYSPYVANLKTNNEIIAVGGEQKNTVCVSKNGYVYLSQYLGDLGEFNCYKNFKNIINHFTNLFDVKEEVIVHDIHPLYLSTNYAKEQEIRRLEVQHHHSHMVSCMAEHSIYDSVIGVIFDGTGFGTDGAIWGGEFFIGNRKSFKRVGQLEYVNIQGGEEAIKEPWRCAVSYLRALGYNPLEIIQDVEKEKIEVVTQALNLGVNCFLSSSLGRFFDCVAALIGIRNYISYDGQAAIELENIIEDNFEESYLWSIKESDGLFKIEYKNIIEGVIKDLKIKECQSKISAKFHNSIVESTCDLISIVREKEGINKVVLSGGVFENEYLLKRLYKNLIERGFEVFYNKQIPTNDGGLSFGQLYAASAIIEKEGEEYVSCNTSQDFRFR